MDKFRVSTANKEGVTYSTKDILDHAADLDAHMGDMFQTLRTGEYLFPYPIESSGLGGTSANRLYAIPFIVVRDLTIDRIAVHVTTGKAASIIRLGLYENGTNLYPGALVVDGGTVSIATTGVKAVTISEALTKGIYWLVMVSDSNPSLEKGNPAYSIMGQSADSFSSGDYANAYWFKDAVGSGALADPFVSGGTLSRLGWMILPRLASLD